MLKLKTSKKIFNNLLFISSTFLLININSGCSRKKNNTAEELQKLQQQYPAWFLSASANDDLKDIYSGVGESINETDAVAQALNSIASRISVEVASTYKSQTKLINNIGSRELSLDIEQNVKKIEFNNYKILKSERLNLTKHIVLVVVNRSELAMNLEDRAKIKLNEIMQSLHKNSYSNRLEKLKKYIQAQKDLNYLKSQVSIIKTVNINFDVNKINNEIMSLENEIILYKNSLNFYIVNINEDSNYKELIKKFLNSYGYSIANNSQNSNIINIKLKIDKSQAIVWGSLVLKASILLEFIDDNKVLLSEQIVAGGKSSSNNIQQAEEFAQRDFEKKLNKSSNLKDIFGEK